MSRFILAACLATAGCTCAQVTIRDAGGTETTDGSTGSDGPGLDGIVPTTACEPGAAAAWRVNATSPTPSFMPTPECLPEWEVACRRNWQAVAPPGTYARSMCAPGRAGCQRADHCDLTSTGWICACGAEGNCASDQLCVSDAPRGGVARCVSACIHDAPSTMTCGADPLVLPVSPYFRPCDADARASCRLWAQAFAPSGYAHAECFEAVVRTVCAMADHCEPPPGGTGAPTCTCNGAICGAGEVCISDRPDAVPSCVAACVPPDPMG